MNWLGRHRCSLGVVCAIAASMAITAGSGIADEIPAATLREGHLGRYAWWAAIESPELEAERREGDVCLAISMLEPISPYRAEGSEVASCGPVPSSRPMTEYLRGGRHKRVRVVFAAVFPFNVRRVFVKIRGKPGQTFSAGHLSESAVRDISPEPLAFFVHGYTHSVCIQRIVGYGTGGEAISRLGKEACRFG